MSIFGLLLALLLFVNAVAILDRRRVIDKYGLLSANRGANGLGYIIQACQSLRIFLIPINLVVVAWMLLLG